MAYVKRRPSRAGLRTDHPCLERGHLALCQRGQPGCVAAEPERFAPAYGVHCAWAAAQGYKAKGDPRHWKIVGGRLFLKDDAHVQKTWQTDIPGFIVSADGNWPRLRQK